MEVSILFFYFIDDKFIKQVLNKKSRISPALLFKKCKCKNYSAQTSIICPALSTPIVLAVSQV